MRALTLPVDKNSGELMSERSVTCEARWGEADACSAPLKGESFLQFLCLYFLSTNELSQFPSPHAFCQ